MEITGLLIFVAIGAWAGWRTGIFMRGGRLPALINGTIGVFCAVAGGALFWFLTTNIGGFISSMVTAVLGGMLLLYLMGFFKKTRTQ